MHGGSLKTTSTVPLISGSAFQYFIRYTPDSLHYLYDRLLVKCVPFQVQVISFRESLFKNTPPPALQRKRVLSLGKMRPSLRRFHKKDFSSLHIYEYSHGCFKSFFSILCFHAFSTIGGLFSGDTFYKIILQNQNKCLKRVEIYFQRLFSMQDFLSAKT